MPRPLTFLPEHIPLIRSGRKTQTRRLLKEQPVLDPKIKWLKPSNKGFEDDTGKFFRTPHKYADLIWVKEACADLSRQRSSNGVVGSFEPQWVYLSDVHEQGIESYGNYEDPERIDVQDIRWLLRYALKAASRITLRCNGLYLEQLSSIVESDAVAEGYPAVGRYSAVSRYEEVWNSIHPTVPFSSNPWVWAYHFEAVPSLAL